LYLGNVCNSTTYGDENKIDVTLCDANDLSGFRVYNFSATLSFAYNLYGYVAGAWSFLISGDTGSSAIPSRSVSNTFIEVIVPRANYKKYRLTFTSTTDNLVVKPDNLKFLQSFSSNCQVRYVFATKLELQKAIQNYTDDQTKKNTIDKYGVINCWSVAKVTDMSNLFYNITKFDEDISCWDTSMVRNMSRMFYNAQSLKGNLQRWDTSNVEDMSEMFVGVSEVKSIFAPWNISNVRTMTRMFYNASFLNQDFCPWYNTIRASVVTAEMFVLSGCTDRSEPNVTSKTSFCQECSCCGGSCFYPVGRCEEGYTCDQTSRKCRKPAELEKCLIRSGESYGCRDGFNCKPATNSTKNICMKPFIYETCKENIGCLDELKCVKKEFCLRADALPMSGALPVSGTDTLLKDCNNVVGQNFYYDNYAKAFRLLKNPDYCLDVLDYGRTGGGKVVTHLCSGKENQQWVMDMSPGRQWIKPVYNQSLSLSFEGQDMSLANAKRLYVYPCIEGKESQMWKYGFTGKALNNVLVLYYPWTNTCSNGVCFTKMNGWTVSSTETVPNINMNVGTGNIGGSGYSDNIAAAYIGYVNFTRNGTWTIFLQSDDGSKLYVERCPTD